MPGFRYIRCSSMIDGVTAIFFGMAGVVFGLGNLAITRWAVQRRRTGRPLPGPLRTWELFGRVPKVSVTVACCEIVLGAAIIVAGIVWR